MANFKLNKRGIQQMTREIQREFDRHPVQVPVESDPRPFPSWETSLNKRPPMREQGPTTIYNGPVFNMSGDSAQLAYGTQGDVTQTSNVQKNVTPGYEPVAQALTKVLEGLSDAGLDEGDQEMVRDEANVVLQEVTKEEPDQGVVKRGVALVKGVLSPVATGAQEAISENAKDWAGTAIKLLTAAVIF